MQILDTAILLDLERNQRGDQRSHILLQPVFRDLRIEVMGQETPLHM